MKEMDELSSGIERLKKNSDSQKRLIEQLQKDRAFLIERTRFLGQKLGEAYVIYEEAGKRILDFVDKETAPIKNQIAELQAETKKLSGMEHELKTHSSYLSKIRSGDETLKSRLAEAEKAIKKLSEMAVLAKSRIDGLKEKEAKEDQALESRLTEIKGHFETQLKTAQDRIGLKISEASEEVLEDATDSINALAASHEEVKKHLSQTSLFVRQLKISTSSLRKQLENAGFTRAEIEKRVSGHQASIKALDSTLSKLTRRLDSISLEDEKLEKRLAELRKSAEDSIGSKVGQLKAHIDSHEKRQTELLDGRISKIESRISEVRKEAEDSIASKAGYLKAHSDAYHKSQSLMLAARLKAVSEDFAGKVAKINERLLVERKQMGNIESLINGKIRDSEKSTHLIKGELEKRLSLHQASIMEIDSAISKLARRLEGISLEDEKLEKRLAELRKRAEDSTDQKIDRMRSHIELADQKQIQLIEMKLRAIAEFEKKISEARKAAEESIGSKVGQLKAHIDSHEKSIDEKLSSKISGVNDFLESRIAGLSGTLDEKVAKINERLAGDRKGLSLRIEEQNAAFAKLAKDQHAHFESAKAEIEKRLTSARANLDEAMNSKAARLKADVNSHQKRQAEFLDAKLKTAYDDFEGEMTKINERFAKERQDITDLKYLINRKIAESQKAVSLREARLEKGIAGARKQTHLSNSALSSRIEKQAADFRGILKEHQEHVQSIKEDMQKRTIGARNDLEDMLSSKAEQLKSHLDASHKRQAEMLETRMKTVAELDKKVSGNQASIMEIDSAISKLARRLEGISLEDEKLEKRLAELRKRAEDSTDQKIDRIRSHIELADQKQLERIDARLKAIAEFDRKISEVRRASEENISSKTGQLKEHVDSAHKRQADLLDAKLKAAYEDFAARIAKIDERLSVEKKGIEDVESLINQRIKGSEEDFDAKLSESYDNIEKRISQVSSHVASEKKAIDSLKAALERDIREEQKALSSKITGLSEKSWQRISGLSDEISAEKKDLAEQRTKFSDRMNAANQAISRLNEFAKSLESRIKKHEDFDSAKIEKNQEAISAAMKRIDSLAVGLEKSGSFAKDLGIKLGRMDSQAYSEGKDLLQKVKSLESGLKASSLEISVLKKQLAEAGSSKASADKRISGMEALLKQLQAAGSTVSSRIEKQRIDFQNFIKGESKNAEFMNSIEKRLSGQQEYLKGLESALGRVVKMVEGANLEDKKLEKGLSGAKEDIMKKLLEEQQSDNKEISSLREELAGLKRGITEWQQEQARLYELLKEED